MLVDRVISINGRVFSIVVVEVHAHVEELSYSMMEDDRESSLQMVLDHDDHFVDVNDNTSSIMKENEGNINL